MHDLGTKIIQPFSELWQRLLSISTIQGYTLSNIANIYLLKRIIPQHSII